MRILAVDDEPEALRYLGSVLEPEHEVCACACGEDALRELGRQTFDLVLADLNMPPPDGFEILRAVQGLPLPPPVVVITAVDSARAAVSALRLGARDYLVKPAGPEEIRAAVARTEAPGAVTGEEPGEELGLVGPSAAIRHVRRLIPLLAQSRETALIEGETGVGKELLARALHEHGPRRAGPFVAHNMAATPTDLAESIFFGHVRGSFSGATADHAGLFEQAHAGTLFLDEIDSFPLPLQAKLLRVLEGGFVQRVGSHAERAVDVRVVAASTAELGGVVAAGAFRADLYYRLRQLEVSIPPLRARAEDIPALVRHLLAGLAREAGRAPRISPSAMDLIATHSWPGNCRELRNALRSAALLAGEDPVLPAHLPRALQAATRGKSPGTGTTTLRAAERKHILEALEQAGGNQSRAARLLGINRGTLARKLRALVPGGKRE